MEPQNLNRMKPNSSDESKQGCAGRRILTRWIIGAVAGLTCCIAWGPAAERVCKDRMVATNIFDAHYAVEYCVCWPNCTVKEPAGRNKYGQWCYDYYHDPPGAIEYVCQPEGSYQETGEACVDRTYTITRTGRIGDPECVHKQNSSECMELGVCKNWRNMEPQQLTLQDDTTTTEGCRTPPGD